MNEASCHKPRRGYRILKILLVLLALSAVLIVVWEWTSKSKLDQAIQAAVAIDPRLTFESLESSRRVWPADQNGALVLLAVAPALDALAKDPQVAHLPVLGEGEAPGLGRRWDGETDRNVSQFLSDHSAVLEAIERVTDCEGGRFPTDSESDWFEVLLSHLRLVRQAARIESLQALYSAQQGDHAFTLEHLERIQATTRMIQDEPYLVSALVDVAVSALTLSGIEESIAFATFSPGELEELNQLLDRMDRPDRLHLAMLGERSISCATTGLIPGGWDTGLSMKLPRYPILRGITHRDLACRLEMYDELIQVASQETGVMDRVRALKDEADNLPAYAMLTRILMPSLLRSFELDQRLTAQIRAAQIALAIERYRIDRRLWPERLDQLVPEYLEAIPTDPFTEGPMGYLVDDNTVVVYSVGEDMADDGGDVNHHRTTEETSATEFGFVLLPPDRRNQAAADHNELKEE